MSTISDFELQSVIHSFRDKTFSTYDFVLALQGMYPAIWRNLEKKYGAGGAGAGKHYSAYSRVAHALGKFANAGGVVRLDYQAAPEGWGSPVIRYWARTDSSQYFPDEIQDSQTVTEGARQTVVVNKYERNFSARAKCIQRWGVTCFVCEFNFEKIYGKRGAGFIHVHHLKALHEIGKSYQLDPIKDLRPVCPNCHAMLHRTVPAISIPKLKKLLAGA